MFTLGFIRDSVLKKLGLQPTNLPSPAKNERSGITRTAYGCKQQLKRRADVARAQCEDADSILGYERQQHWGDKGSDTSGVETLASPARQFSGGKGVTISATHDPTPSTSGGHRDLQPSNLGATREAARTLVETHIKCTVTSAASETSATAVDPPAPRPTDLRLLLPGDGIPGVTTSSSGSSSPEVFFDATDDLWPAPPAYTHNTHIGDTEEYYKSLGETQEEEEAEVYKEDLEVTQEDSTVRVSNINRRQGSTQGNQEYEIVGNALFPSGKYGTNAELRHDDEHQIETTRDHKEDSCEMISHRKPRGSDENNVAGAGYMWDGTENNESEHREKTRDATPNPEINSQGSDFWDVKVKCDHWEGSESLDVKTSYRKLWEGEESHSSGEGRLDSRQEWAPASLPLDRYLDASHDVDLFDDSGGSEWNSLPPSTPSPTVGSSRSAAQERAPKFAASSNSASSQAGHVTEVEVSGTTREAAPENECKQSLYPLLGPRADCQNEASKINEPNACKRRLPGEVFPTEKSSGDSNLREETRRIVMMLSNDRTCKVPRPSLGLQDRLRTLSQRSAGRRPSYVKGPRFCSTVVKSIVRNTHDRLQSRRDSFQEFITSRREQTVQRVFANPIPCYGGAGATVASTQGTSDSTVGEKCVPVGVMGSEGRREGACSTTIKGSATAASQTTVTPPGVPSSTTVEVAPPICRPQEDTNDCIMYERKLSSANKNGRNVISNANTTTLGKDMANSHETDTNEVLFGAKLPADDTSGTDIPNNSEAVCVEAVTPGPSSSSVFQDSIDDERQTVVLLEDTMTDCDNRQHGAPSSLTIQAIRTEDTQTNFLPDTLEYGGGHLSETTTSTADVLDEVPGAPAPFDYHETTKTPFSTSYSPTGGQPHTMGATSILKSPKNKEISNSKTKPHFPKRPRENSCGAVDLQTHIASLNKVSPKLINRLTETRIASERAGKAGDPAAAGRQDQELVSATSFQDFHKTAEISQNSSFEESENLEMTICDIPSDSKNKVHESEGSENFTEVTETNNLADVPQASSTSPSNDTGEVTGTNKPHSEDAAGNILIQEEVLAAGELKTLSCEASRPRYATSSHREPSGEARPTLAGSSEPHHPWSCLEDITKLKTDNLVARFRGIRSLLQPVLPSQHPKHQPTAASIPPQHPTQPIPISPHPQPSSCSTTVTATHNKGQTSIDDLKKHSADDPPPPPLPPNTRQDNVEDCPLLPDSRQGSMDKRYLRLYTPQSSVDECPNLRQCSNEGCPPPAPESREGSVADSPCVGQRNRPRGRLNSRRDSSGGRLPFYAERKRSRANSYHPRSRQGSADCVRPSNRRDSRNIHQSCYSDDRRDSNNACLHPRARRGSRISFGQDLLRKCLEAAVGRCDDVDWEETREEEVPTGAMAKEDLNKSLSKAVCRLDAEKTRALLKLGADPNVRCGHSPALLRAARDGALYVVQALLAAGADVDVRSDTGNSSLHVAARGGFSEVVIQLVHSGAHVDAINRSGVTPLQMALARGHLEVARTLLRLHADMFLPNKVGETAYEVANHLGYTGLSETPREVRRASTPGTWVEPTPTEVPVAVRMIQGIEDGCPATVEACLAEGASPDTVVPLALHWPAYATVLHRAAHHGHDLIVQLLLAAGAHVNRQDVVGNTPLHAAAQSGYNRVVKILLREGALLEANSQSGMTPLHRAASKGRELTCNLLLRRGCDPQAQDNDGLTPADWARKRGFKPLAKKLVYRRKSSASLLADAHHTRYLQHLNQLHEAALKAAEQGVDPMDCPE